MGNTIIHHYEWYASMKKNNYVCENLIKNYLNKICRKAVRIVTLRAFMSSPARIFLFARRCALEKDFLYCDNSVLQLNMHNSIGEKIRIYKGHHCFARDSAVNGT